MDLNFDLMLAPVGPVGENRNFHLKLQKLPYKLPEHSLPHLFNLHMTIKYAENYSKNALTMINGFYDTLNSLPLPQKILCAANNSIPPNKKTSLSNCPNSSNQNNRKRNPYKKLLRIQKLTPEKKRREKNLIKGHHKNNRLYSHK